jgi:hypothetical protein
VAAHPGQRAGRGPWATDGPWQLLTDDIRAGGTWEAWRQRIDLDRAKVSQGSSERRIMGLDSDQVARRDEVTEWLLLVPEADRQLVMAAIWQQARTGQRIRWASMLAVVGQDRGKEGLRKRYQRALTAVADRLNRRKLAA